MDKVYVKDVREKDQLKSIFQVVRKTQNTAKHGKPFLAVALADKTGELDARIWDKLDELGAKFDKGDLVLVEGLVGSFQGRPQLRIDAIEKSDGAGLDAAEFAAPPKASPQDRNFQHILEMVDRIRDPHLKALLKSILDDEKIAADFKRAPAAKSIHHAHPGGLCEHTLSTMRLALKVGEHYPMADRDLLVAGALVHDLGKIRELSWGGGSTEYTDEGRLVGHLVITVEMIHDHARKIDGFPKALETHLSHIALSHHGTLEYGSPRLPQTLEAVLVHYVDELDSRVASWLEIMQRDPGENWTEFQRLYERHLWKGIAPTENGKAPVERRQRGERKPQQQQPKPHREARPQGEQKKPEPKPETAAEPVKARPPEKRPRKEKPEEKLTFKPFATLAPEEPQPPAEPTEAAVEEPKPAEAAPEPPPPGPAPEQT